MQCKSRIVSKYGNWSNVLLEKWAEAVKKNTGIQKNIMEYYYVRSSSAVAHHSLVASSHHIIAVHYFKCYCSRFESLPFLVIVFLLWVIQLLFTYLLTLSS